MPGSHRDIEALAAALWHRNCDAFDVSPDDPKLLSGAHWRFDQPDHLGAAAVPEGVDGCRWLAEQYLDRLPRHIRSAPGRFYTPRFLADALAGQALAASLPADGLLVDPACGGGSLLSALVEQLVSECEPEGALSSVIRRVRGTDLDPIAVALCDLAIRIALLRSWSSIEEAKRPALTRFATVGDGLAGRHRAALVIANPPFGRARLAPETRAEHRDVLYGHAHWPTLFLHGAISRLVEGGTAAFVVPASLVGGLYYRRLRQYLMSAAPPTWIGFVEERTGVFNGDVLQEALLATFRRGREPGAVAVERIGESKQQIQLVSAERWDDGRPWLMARHERDVDLVTRALTRERRLRDYGWNVSTGPLVWNRHRPQLFDDPGDDRIPVLWASDVRGGRVVIEGRARRYFEPRADQPWLILCQPAVLVQRTTAPEQPRRLIAAFLDEETLKALGGRVVVENHLNVCTWRDPTPLPPELFVDYLSGEEADRLYRCMTGSVAVSAFELGELPLPEFDSAEQLAA